MAKQTKKALLIATLMGSVCVSATAFADVYVSTEAQLRSAFNNASPGTTITLENGTYNLTGRLVTRTGGSSSGLITVRARNANQAIIVTNGAEEAFQISHPYWRFINLFVRVRGNGSYHAYKFDTDGHHGRVTGGKMELHPGAESGVKVSGGPNAPWPDNGVIESTEIYFTAPTTYYLAEGIDAVAVNGWWIRNNIIRDIFAGTSGVGYGAFTKGNSSGTVIENNLFYNCFIPISLGGGGTGSQYMRNYDGTYEDRGGIIRNNVTMNSRDVALYLYKSNNSRVYNNTFYNSYTSCGTGCSSIDVRLQGATAEIRNNILDKPINNREGGTHTAQANQMLPSPTHTGWFVDVNARNFRLRSTAPAINAGVMTSLVTRDMFNVVRIGLPDAGATEYTGL